jgi:hypothetical protein
MTIRRIVTSFLGIAGAAILATGIVIKADQPHMQQSLSMMQSAMSELRAATADKGGHRGKAMGLLKEAMDEVKAGIEFAAK